MDYKRGRQSGCLLFKNKTINPENRQASTWRVSDPRPAQKTKKNAENIFGAFDLPKKPDWHESPDDL